MKSKVYFTKELSPEAVVKMYEAVGVKLEGSVAVKVHSGEKGNQNYLRPEFLKPMIEHVGGTVVECNTAYQGARNSTEKHKELIKEHGWTDLFNVDILDDEEPDMILEIKNGKLIKQNYVGKNLKKYDSVLVLSHFKGHPMGGFGGALKQLSIGFASSRGKCYIHTAGATLSQEEIWKKKAAQNDFIDAMAESAGTIVDMFKDKIVFVNMMCNMSVDCDCCAVAEDPCMKDIGILSSTDPVALDKACIDLIYNSKDKGRDHLIEKIETRNGTRIIETANELGYGTQEYELIIVE